MAMSKKKDDNMPTVYKPPYSVRDLAALTEDTPIQHLPHNVDLSRPGAVETLYEMAGRSGLAIQPGQSVEIVLRHWLIMPDMAVDETTGEARPIIRTILSDGNGSVFASSSQVLPKRLKQLLLLFPDGLPDCGVRVRIVDRPSRRPGYHYHDIQIVG